MTGNKSAIIHVSAINAVAQYVSPFRRNRRAGFLAPAHEIPTETFEHEPIEFCRSRQETHPPDSNHDEHAGMRKACGGWSIRATTDSIGPDSSLRPLAPEGPEQRGMHQDQNPGEGAHRHGR